MRCSCGDIGVNILNGCNFISPSNRNKTFSVIQENKIELAIKVKRPQKSNVVRTSDEVAIGLHGSREYTL